MPYKLVKDGEMTCVHNSDTGENKGCSKTHAMAVAHMRALYAASKGEKMGKKELEVDSEAMIVKAIGDFEAEFGERITPEEVAESLAIETKDMGMMMDMESMSYTLATSYADLDAEADARDRMMEANELINKFPMLARNVMADPGKEDKAAAVESLASELASRLQSLDEHKDMGKDEKKEVAQAKKSWFGNLVDQVKEAMGVSNFDTEEEESKESDGSSVMVFKGTDGAYMWFARYSNNFRDNDLVPEIISEGSHRKFVDSVDKGLAPYPELWIWHMKELSVGRANWLAYDDEGFALAAGYFNKGYEPVAEWLTTQNMLVSHGMPIKSIVRDPSDPTVIIEHRTSEISPLPPWAAANKITGFLTSHRKGGDEEVDMIPDGKKEALKKMGFPEAFLAKTEADNASAAAKAVAEGVESKENAAVTQLAAEAAPVTPSETPKTEQPVEEEAKEAPLTRKEIADAFTSVFTPVLERLEALEATNKELAAAVQATNAAVKEQDEKVRTPVAGLAAMFAEAASRNKGTPIEVDDPLLNMKPKESAAGEARTGIPFIDTMLASNNGKR